jgi:hypothetical protein
MKSLAQGMKKKPQVEIKIKNREIFSNTFNPNLASMLQLRQYGKRFVHMSSLEAVSLIDGRYSHALPSFGNWFSEHAMNKHRVAVEIGWLVHISDLSVRMWRCIDYYYFYRTEQRHECMSAYDTSREQRTYLA